MIAVFGLTGPGKRGVVEEVIVQMMSAVDIKVASSSGEGAIMDLTERVGVEADVSGEPRLACISSTSDESRSVSRLATIVTVLIVGTRAHSTSAWYLA